jgi:hypothetical protein
LSGKSALVEGVVGLLEELGMRTGAGGACATGPLKVTGASTSGGVITATGGLLAGTFSRPTE